jgi:predicted NACHT family NTPase
MWASQKSQAIPAETKDATARAFYLALARTPHLVSDFALANSLDQGMLLDAALDGLLQTCAIDQSPDLAHASLCGDALSDILGIVLDAGFHKSLQQLRSEYPNPVQNHGRFQTWWEIHHETWAEHLKTAIDRYRQIHHHWQFDAEQQQTLQRYYTANQLLLDCLHSNCEVTAKIRQDIESTLLLPQKELEAREWR